MTNNLRKIKVNNMQSVRVAINGFGRIGRLVLRSIIENNKDNISVVAINDLAPIETSIHLLKYDSVHGTFQKNIVVEDSVIKIENHKIQMLCQKNPEELPWKNLNVDIVMECSGFFTSKENALSHIKSGAKKVLISAPGTNVDATVVYGVNHKELSQAHQIISNASCTTNCCAPLIKVLNDNLLFKKGYMTTIHSYTGDQRIIDTAHKDTRRARAASLSMIPTSTGAAKAVGLVIPEIKGKIDGCAIRIPTPNVSMIDLTFETKENTSAQEINKFFKKASETYLNGVLEYNKEKLVSIDFNHNPSSSIFDSTQTQVVEGNFCRIVSWYDNEWGFANRMVDVAIYMHNI